MVPTGDGIVAFATNVLAAMPLLWVLSRLARVCWAGGSCGTGRPAGSLMTTHRPRIYMSTSSPLAGARGAALAFALPFFTPRSSRKSPMVVE